MKPVTPSRIRAAHAAPRCQHIKANGVRCGSPAQRAKTVCYFHFRYNQEADFLRAPLEDANSIQCAIMQVIRALSTGHMECRVAGLLLYGLQLASSNARLTNFDPFQDAANPFQLSDSAADFARALEVREADSKGQDFIGGKQTDESFRARPSPGEGGVEESLPRA